jgi:hypothetical protein
MRGIVQQLTERMHQTPEQAQSGLVTTRANEHCLLEIFHRGMFATSATIVGRRCSVPIK